MTCVGGEMQTTAAGSETCLSNSGTKPQTLKLHAKVYPIRAAQGTRLKHIAEKNRQLVAAGGSWRCSLGVAVISEGGSYNPEGPAVHRWPTLEQGQQKTELQTELYMKWKKTVKHEPAERNDQVQKKGKLLGRASQPPIPPPLHWVNSNGQRTTCKKI